MDKSREQFEAWAEEVGALPWGYLKKQRMESGNYSVQIYTYMWNAWQASRESIVICTPNPNYNFGGKSEDYKTGFCHRVFEMNKQWAESITSLGLKVKTNG